MLSSTASDLGTEVGPCTARIIQAVKTIWPGHEKFLRSSFAARSPELLDTTEIISSLLDKTATFKSKSIEEFAEDYRFLCEKIVYPEELYFRRNGEYRLKTFEDANTEVYSNDEVMSRYMNGLFVSDVLWLNHASAMNDFAKVYLPTLAPGGRHLRSVPAMGCYFTLRCSSELSELIRPGMLAQRQLRLFTRILDMLGESDRVELAIDGYVFRRRFSGKSWKFRCRRPERGTRAFGAAACCARNYSGIARAGRDSVDQRASQWSSS